MGDAEKTGIERRALIKGAAVVGGAVWAVPVVQTLDMPVAAAVSPNRPVLPGSSGALFTNAAAVAGVALNPWTCSPLTAGDVRCLDHTPETSDGCSHVFVNSNPSDHTQLVLCIAVGWKLQQGRARCPDGSCTMPTPFIPVGSVCNEQWLFSCGGGNFNHVEVLVVPDV